MIYYGRNEKHLKILNIMESEHTYKVMYIKMKLGIGPRDWDEHAKLYYCMKQMVKRGFIEKVSSGYYKITTHGMTMRDEWTKGADNE